MDVTEHLDPASIYDLIEGRLPAPEERLAEAHLCRCGPCRALREECGATLSALRWYAAEPPPPPAGYWQEFWHRWAARAAGGVHPSTRRRPLRRLAPVLALAASVALAIGLWPRPGGEAGAGTMTASAPLVREAEWSEDYERFERFTIAVGSVDPMSKGVALASLAEAP